MGRDLSLLLKEAILEDPEVWVGFLTLVKLKEDNSLSAHGLTSEEAVVVKVAEDLLDNVLGTGHETLDTVGVGLLEVGLDGSHVSLDVSHVRLLVKGGLLEGVGDNELIDGLGRGVQLSWLLLVVVGDILTLSLDDHLRLNLVDAVLLNGHGEGIRENLITRNDVLENKHIGL